MTSVPMILTCVVGLFNLINCFPTFEQRDFNEIAKPIDKRNLGEVQALVDENFPMDNSLEDQERFRHKLIQLLIFVLENKNMDGKNEADSEKMRKIREIVSSKFENLNFLDKLDKIRSIGKPLKNEHRHVFIGK